MSEDPFGLKASPVSVTLQINWSTQQISLVQILLVLWLGFVEREWDYLISISEQKLVLTYLDQNANYAQTLFLSLACQDEEYVLCCR